MNTDKEKLQSSKKVFMQIMSKENDVLSSSAVTASDAPGRGCIPACETTYTRRLALR